MREVRSLLTVFQYSDGHRFSSETIKKRGQTMGKNTQKAAVEFSSEQRDARWQVWDFTKSQEQSSVKQSGTLRTVQGKGASVVSSGLIGQNVGSCLRRLEEAMLRISFDQNSSEAIPRALESALHSGLFESSKALQTLLSSSGSSELLRDRGDGLREQIDSYRVFLIKQRHKDLSSIQERGEWNDKVRAGIRSFLAVVG